MLPAMEAKQTENSFETTNTAPTGPYDSSTLPLLFPLHRMAANQSVLADNSLKDPPYPTGLSFLLEIHCRVLPHLSSLWGCKKPCKQSKMNNNGDTNKSLAPTHYVILHEKGRVRSYGNIRRDMSSDHCLDGPTPGSNVFRA